MTDKKPPFPLKPFATEDQRKRFVDLWSWPDDLDVFGVTSSPEPMQGITIEEIGKAMSKFVPLNYTAGVSSTTLNEIDIIERPGAMGLLQPLLRNEQDYFSGLTQNVINREQQHFLRPDVKVHAIHPERFRHFEWGRGDLIVMDDGSVGSEAKVWVVIGNEWVMTKYHHLMIDQQSALHRFYLEKDHRQYVKCMWASAKRF